MKLSLTKHSFKIKFNTLMLGRKTTKSLNIKDKQLLKRETIHSYINIFYLVETIESCINVGMPCVLS